MQFVILGATGFIGKAIYHYLQSTNIKTVGLSSKNIDLTEINQFKNLDPILTPDTIVIFSSAITKEYGDSEKIMQKNIQMATNLGLYLVKKNIKKCTFLSSTDVYGYSTDLPITEKSKINPQTPYAVSKYKSELILKAALKKQKIPFLIMRYNGVFGPGQKSIKYGPNSFIDSIIHKKKVEIWGDGTELRDLLFVNDLAKIIIDLSISKHIGIYNIASGKSGSFLEIVDYLKQILLIQFDIISKKRSGAKFDQIFDNKKLQLSLPELYFTPIKEALIKTYQQST